MPTRSRIRSTAISGGHLFLVGPGGGERIEDLDGSDDPGPERNGLAGEPVGIAEAVPPLVVAADEGDDFLQVDQRREDLGADEHVLLHVLVLLVGERALLVEDLLADPDLADVVQPPAGADRLDQLVGAAQLRRHAGGEIGDPGGVAAEVGVLRLQRVHQRLQRGDRDPLLIGLLQPLLRHAQRHLLLEPLIDLLALEGGVPLLQRALDGAAEVAQIDGLDEVVERAALHAECGAGRVVDRGQHEDRHVRLELQDPRHQLDAVDAGEVHVEQHAGDLLAAEHGEGLLARGRRRDLVALEDQILPHRAPDRLLVVHDQESHGCIVHGRALLRRADPGRTATRAQPAERVRIYSGGTEKLGEGRNRVNHRSNPRNPPPRAPE